MFSALGKAMDVKTVSWGGHCYSNVKTANDKAKFLELNCIMSQEVGDMSQIFANKIDPGHKWEVGQNA